MPALRGIPQAPFALATAARSQRADFWVTLLQILAKGTQKLVLA